MWWSCPTAFNQALIRIMAIDGDDVYGWVVKNLTKEAEARGRVLGVQ